MSAQQLNLLEATHTPLATLLPKANFEPQLPLTFRVEEHQLKVITQQSTITSQGDDTELVVLGTLSSQQLLKLAHALALNELVLTTINHRLTLASYRFNVQCRNIDEARTVLANFALQEQIEAALLVNAPTLASPGLLLMDMDSTTIEIECIDEIAKLAGVGEQVAQVTERAMQGELDFAQSLIERVATLKDAPESILADVARDIPLMNGLIPLIDELKLHQWRVAVASGGFTYFADHLKTLLALDDVKANVLEIIDGALTGKVVGNIVDAQAKADTLAELGAKYDIATQQFVAMGDGANDLVMMKAAQLGVAFHAKPVVLKQADCAINTLGLDCLIHWLR